MADVKADLVDVFVAGSRGGNPAPVVLDAKGLSSDEMQKIAAKYGHEAGFVLPPSDPARADVQYRFFVPRHEMEMCGHATLASAHLLWERGDAPISAPITFRTRHSGRSRARWACCCCVRTCCPAMPATTTA